MSATLPEPEFEEVLLEIAVEDWLEPMNEIPALIAQGKLTEDALEDICRRTAKAQESVENVALLFSGSHRKKPGSPPEDPAKDMGSDPAQPPAV